MNITGPNSAQPKSRWWLPVLSTIMILWLATGLRFFQIAEQSFWNDEGNSARLSERSLPLIIEGTASDIHPPLYYVLLRGWRELMGEHEFGLRAFSAYTGILTVAAIGPLSALLFNKNRFRNTIVFLIPLASFLAAVNPALIYYSRETRMYALLALLSALSTIALIRWLNAEIRRFWTILYIVTATAGLYTHYFFPAILLLQSVIVIIWSIRYFAKVMFAPFEIKRRQSIRGTLLSWLGMMVIIFLLYSPWLPIFFRQVGGRPGQREVLSTFLWDSVRWLAFGETIAAGDLFWPSVAIVLLCLSVVIKDRGRSIIPVLGTFLPVLLMYASGATQPAFFKFLLTAVPFFVLLLSGGLDKPHGSNRRLPGLILPIALLFFILMGTVFSLNNLYNNPAYERADYRGMAARIAEEAHPNAGIILNAPNQWEVFTYYHRQGAPVYPLPKGQPDPAILEPQLTAIAADHDRLYALYWGEHQRDPQQVVERWLDNNTFKATEEWIGDVRFVVYAVPTKPASTMDTPANLKFDEHIFLDGYSLNASQFLPGDIVQLTLFWHADQPVEERYKVFVHLVDEKGKMVAQRDGEPGGGQAITSEWLSGQRIIDNHGLLLPGELPPGSYQLVIGLYDIQDPNDRLTIKSNSGLQDSWIISSITVN